MARPWRDIRCLLPSQLLLPKLGNTNTLVFLFREGPFFATFQFTTMTKTLTINTTDLGTTMQFPEYLEPIDLDIDFDIDNMAAPDRSPQPKMVDQLLKSPDRQPSPQPTHFSVPYRNGKNGSNGNGNGNGHRVLRSATVGYVAPEFKGKQAQMLQGQSYISFGRGE